MLISHKHTSDQHVQTTSHITVVYCSIFELRLLELPAPRLGPSSYAGVTTQTESSGRRQVVMALIPWATHVLQRGGHPAGKA
ncbi:hypothetical protein PROFUN_16063 [Planoprotostelium fungivorum]|uniref:Uncharacterized protein n=1 Tax=Planoprotostelium fungivorum TaxID=1890364 RepID=A0A2P6MS86_9EUKA|nr:hypothetical protein PROFUN_16063 [Planoprotostelium fungivorum]